MNIQHPEQIWLISVLSQFATDAEWDKICMATGNSSINAKIVCPKYQFGYDIPSIQVLLRHLSSKLSDVLDDLVELSNEVENKLASLYEYFSVSRGYRNGCITNFSWNVAKYPATSTACNLCVVFRKEIQQTGKRLKAVWDDYERSREVPASSAQSLETERDPDDPPPPKRRRIDMGADRRRTTFLMRWLETTFRDMFDLFLHICVLRMYVGSSRTFLMNEFTMFFVTPLDFSRAELELDKLFWEKHRQRCVDKSIIPAYDVATPSDKALLRPYSFITVDLFFLDFPV